jgi:hypothetical protein
MTEHGSSLIMNWGEDTGMWECSWITGGVRIIVVSKELEAALTEARIKALAHFHVDA